MAPGVENRTELLFQARETKGKKPTIRRPGAIHPIRPAERSPYEPLGEPPDVD